MSPMSRKRNDAGKPKIPGRYLLLIVTALCISLIVLTYRFDALSSFLNNTVSYLVVPFQNGISRVGAYFVERKQLANDIETLQEENAALQEENDTLKQENADMTTELSELDELRELYDLDGTYASYEKTGARVIAKDTGNWYHSFTIDKGSDDGIEVDMNVIADGGLVGRITSVGSNWARVETIIDDDSNVTATVQNTSSNCIVSGNLTLYEEGTIEFERLSDTQDLVSVGDRVVTSNISDKYLPGILIGYVARIQKDPNNLTKSGLITPAVDFSYIDTVLVIMETKQTVDEEAATSETTESTEEAATEESTETATTEAQEEAAN